MSDTHAQREKKFLAFHAANPHVYTELLRLALEAKRNGARKIGIRMLWEVMRWNQRRYIHTDDPGSDYKLNDHYPPFYARLLMEQEPELAGLFELRGEHLAAVESVRHQVTPDIDPTPSWHSEGPSAARATIPNRGVDDLSHGAADGQLFSVPPSSPYGSEAA